MTEALPLAQEIRAVRARAERAHAASLLHRRVQGSLHAATILESQVAEGAPYDENLPGDEDLEQAQAWMSMDLDPVEGGVLLQLRVRRERLQQVLGVLSPLVDEAEEISAQLHELQHQQRHELEKPKWTLVVAELVEIGTRRDEAAQAMAGVRALLSKVEPLVGVLAGFLPQLSLELAAATGRDDEDGVVAWRTSKLAQQQLIGLVTLMNQLEVVLPVPFEPAVPDRAHPRHRDRLRDETQAVLLWMHDLSSRLEAREAMLQERLSAIRDQHTRAEDELKERMG